MTVTMQSPDGEVREVEATEKELVPLMVKGWKQIEAPPVAPAGEKQ